VKGVRFDGVVLAVSIGLAASCGRGREAVPLPDLRAAEAAVREAILAEAARVRSAPKSAAAWAGLGDRLRAHGFEVEAAACYREASRLEPAAFLWPYLEAISLLERDLGAAAEALHRALERDGNYAPAHVRSGWVLVALGRFEEARSSFERALALEPTNAHAEVGLARCAMEAGDLASARRHLETAVAWNPRFREARLLLSQVVRALGDEPAAAREERAAAGLPKKTDPVDPRAVRPVAPVGSRANNDRGIELAREGRPAEAVSFFEEALRIDPTFAEAHYNLGTVLARTGRTGEALGHLREAVRLGPERADPRVNLAVALAAQGEVSQAEAELRAAIEAEPGHALAHFHLGRLLERQERTAEAAAEFREALEADPSWPEPAWKLAWILATSPEARIRDGREAVRLAERACATTRRGNPMALDALAAAYAAVGRFPEAERTAREAARVAFASGRNDLVGAILDRAALYARGRPHRGAPAGDRPAPSPP